MSNRWFPLAVAALLVGLTGIVASRIASQERPLAHEDLLCRHCHAGIPTHRAEPHVPQEVCVACHPAESLTGDAGEFDHALHGGAEPVELGCVGCHHHEEGNARLGTGRETCALCHAGEMDGADGEGCRSCHRPLPGSVVTSQGVPIRHGVFEWMDDACLRCHYAVSAPPTLHDACGTCHGEGPPPAAPEADLHGSHLQVACAACHDGGAHRITAMSKAIRVACADCHNAPHGAGPEWATEGPDVCGTCHAQVHQAQQRLFLGIAPGDVGPEPSPKFLAGLSCRGCHVGEAGAEGHGVDRGSCQACHEARYGRVTDWWTQGGRERAATVAAYLQGAGAALRAQGMAPETAGLDQAGAWIRLVLEGGAQHNPSLSHRLLRLALTRGVDAYRLSGAIVPMPPVLGMEPRPGECSYCHYDIPFRELDVFLGSSRGFHGTPDP
ncbi:MAG TPA: hypothetical protein VLA43_14820 [Longimicrobiales bacterium]|nr:hypothetical protein [Longimicrobiales bacterium]